MAAAKKQYFTHARWEHFKERSREWQAINRHRAFIDAARANLDRYDGEDREVIQHQLDEAEGTVDKLDPVRHLTRIVPSVPEPKAEDLKPFLQGWSPRGPEEPSW